MLFFPCCLSKADRFRPNLRNCIIGGGGGGGGEGGGKKKVILTSFQDQHTGGGKKKVILTSFQDQHTECTGGRKFVFFSKSLLYLYPNNQDAVVQNKRHRNVKISNALCAKTLQYFAEKNVRAKAPVRFFSKNIGTLDFLCIPTLKEITSQID